MLRSRSPERSLTSEFEERETQAAESWRIQGVAQASCRIEQTLAILRFSHHHMRSDSGQLECSALECEGARYAEIPWINLQAKTRIETFNSESLILAQNERWRQA